jgi:PST family polysaccharide transporter
LKRTLRAAAASSTGTAAGIVAGLVRVKLFALFLGPAGLGVVSQIANVLQALSVGSNLGLGIAVTKSIASARGRGDAAAVRLAAWTSFLTVVATAAFASVALALAAPLVAGRLVGDSRLAAAVAVAAVAVLFAAAGQIGTDIANGLRDVRTTSLGGIAGSLVSVTFVAALVPRFGLQGAIACLPLIAGGAAAASLGILVARQRDVLFPPSRPPFSAPVLASFAKIGFVSLAMGLADQLVLLAVRTDLIRRYGLEANGFFQGTFGISQQIVAVAVAFHGAYSFPRVSEARSGEEVNRETQEAFRVTLLLLGAAAGVLVLGRHLLVRGLLSRQFAVSLAYLPWQAAGHFARGAGLAVALGVLPRAGVRAWALLGLGSAAAFGISYAALAPFLGPAAPSVAWCASGWLFLAIACVLMRRATDLRLGRRNYLVLGLAAPVIATLARLSGWGPVGWAAGAAVIAGWLAIAIRPGDVDAARRYVRNRFGRGDAA